MMYRFIIYLLIIFSVQLFGQNYFSGNIDNTTVWQDEVYIDGDVTVSQGVVLTIVEGTRIYFKPQVDARKSGKDKERAEIIVNGVIRAKSSNPFNPIVFTSASNNPQMNDWYGLVIKNFFDPSEFLNCIIEFGYKGITCYGSSPVITGGEIRFNHNSGISCEVKSSPLISDALIFGNGFAGINCELASNPQVSGCTILENNFGVIIFSKSSPDLGTYPLSPQKSRGENRLSNNFEFDIYNHSANTIYAQNNSWISPTVSEIQNAIYDRSENPSYGEVIFQPVFRERRRPAQYPALVAANTQPNTADSARRPSPDNVPDQGGGGPAIIPPAKSSDTLLASLVTRKNVPLTAQPVRREQSSALASPAELKSSGSQENVQGPILEAFLDAGKREYRQRENPRYPPIYMRTGTEGDVIIEVIVGFSGDIEEYRILKSDGDLFSESAIAALKKFQYKPGKFNGQPVQFKIIERFRFKLN